MCKDILIRIYEVLNKNPFNTNVMFSKNKIKRPGKAQINFQNASEKQENVNLSQSCTQNKNK